MMGLAPPAVNPAAFDLVGEQHEGLLRDPVWWIAREECTPSCLNVLWPFVGGLLNQRRLVEEVNRERIRPLFRCISQLHERAELAESQAQHWKAQWYNAYGQALEQQQKAGAVSLGSHAAVSDLQDTIAAMAQERDRLKAEVNSLHEVMRSSFFERIEKDQENTMRMRTFERASQQHLGESVNQHFAIEERLQSERASVQQLQGELKRLAMQLAGEGAVRRHVEEQLRSAEQNAFNTRLDAENRVQHTLFEQRKKAEESLRAQESAVVKERESRHWDPTRAEALATLRAFAALWRCACTPYAGLHGRQAEQALRTLMQVSNLLPSTSELVQEPLRRAVGDRAAIEIGEVLACEAAQGLGPDHCPVEDPGQHTQGSWCRWEGASMPQHQSLHSRPPILESHVRDPGHREFG